MFQHANGYKTMKKLILLLAATLMSTPLLADDEDYIKYRQDVMKSLSANLKASSMILKGKVDLNANLKRHAQAIADGANMTDGLFPEGSDFGDTDAKMDIWDHPDQFAEKIEAFKEAANTFNANATLKTFGEVGKACKSCHKKFREK